ncbi:MAG: YjjG family noncanonical pyrimidine nucleotidase [Balneolales bacterium]|nr:YjjG family noncanonical pyrimidine nucleotidase [Balneolales bacterium]
MFKPSFIYFDLDDTLLDHKSAQDKALSYVYTQYLNVYGDAPPLDLFSKTYARINTDLWHRYSIGKIDRPYLEKHRFKDTLTELKIHVQHPDKISIRYIQAYARYWQWIDGARDCLMQLCREYRVGFITNGFAETQRKKILHFGLDALTQQIVISEEVGYLKPSPEIFEYAEKLAETPSSKILYVGDNFNSDIKGGASAGWKTAWYIPDDIPHNKQLSDNPDYPEITFSTFSQLERKLIV